jgi:hypothetical protein
VDKTPRGSASIAYDSRIVFELATRLRNPVEVMREYGYDQAQARLLIVNETFQNDLKRCVGELVDGVTFRTRARMMASDALEQVYNIVRSQTAGDSVRVDGAKWLAKMGELEPKEKSTGGNNAFVFQIIGVKS